MSAERRIDPLFGARVVIAEARARRPEEWPSARPSRAASIRCPFCPGHEAETPPEIAAGRPEGSRPDGPGWSWRLVPNRYPAFEEGDRSRAGRLAARGRHEVFIETPRHEARLADLGAPALAERLCALRDRATRLARPPTRCVLQFRNGGPAAGASLSHPHSQLVALDRRPPRTAARIRRERRLGGGCLLCEVVRREEEDGRRIVRREAGFLVVCPYASRFPAEAWIVPPHAEGAPCGWSDAILERLAVLLAEHLRSLDAAFEEPDTNLVLPWFVRGRSTHWPIEVIPRLSRIGGFELGSGEFLNGLPPERAARRLASATARGGAADAQRPGR